MISSHSTPVNKTIVTKGIYSIASGRYTMSEQTDNPISGNTTPASVKLLFGTPNLAR